MLSSAISRNATNAIANVPPDRPSSPSVRFTPLAAAMIANAAKMTYTAGSIGDRSDERHRDGGDVVRRWICQAATKATTVSQISFWRARIPVPVRAFR